MVAPERPAEVPTPTAADFVAALGLAPHPEGGWYRETYVGPAGPDGRAASTAIYFLLTAGSPSTLHRVVDADEVFHWYAGAPVEQLVVDGAAPRVWWLGPLGGPGGSGVEPQRVVPAGAWQGCRVDPAAGPDAWALVGCTVAPGFVFDRFELADPETVAHLRAVHAHLDDLLVALAPPS